MSPSPAVLLIALLIVGALVFGVASVLADLAANIREATAR